MFIYQQIYVQDNMKKKLLNIPKHIKVRVNGKLYKQVNLTKANVKIGILVLDLSDGLYTEIKDVYNDKKCVAIAAGLISTEIGVPFNRLRLLRLERSL